MRDYWTDERTTTLKSMWELGCSGGVIARKLGGGITRNAVIGKAFRMGFSHSEQSRSQTARLRQRKRVKPAPKPRRPRIKELLTMPTEPLPVEDVPRGPLVSFADLEPHHCRAIYGDPKMPGWGYWGYCGCQVVPGQSWCEMHVRRFLGGRPPTPPSTSALNPSIPSEFRTHMRRGELVR